MSNQIAVQEYDVPEKKQYWGLSIIEIVSLIARVVLGIVWIYAGASKMMIHHALIMDSINNYKIFTPEWSSILAHWIGPLELIGGILLLLGVFTRFHAMLSIIVLGLFIIGITQAWSRGLILDCGCFGTSEITQEEAVSGYIKVIIRDTIMILFTLLIFFYPVKKYSFDRFLKFTKNN